jgi:hypothetical protein
VAPSRRIGEMRAASDVAEVAFHESGSGVGVVVAQGFDDFAVFAHAAVGRMRAAVEREDEGAAGDELCLLYTSDAADERRHV